MSGLGRMSLVVDSFVFYSTGDSSYSCLDDCLDSWSVYSVEACDLVSDAVADW